VTEDIMLEIFLNKKYFYPNQYKKTIYNIDFNFLKKIGIEYILLDLDNTLVSYEENLPTEKLKNLIKKIISEIFIKNIIQIN